MGWIRVMRVRVDAGFGAVYSNIVKKADDVRLSCSRSLKQLTHGKTANLRLERLGTKPKVHQLLASDLYRSVCHYLQLAPREAPLSFLSLLESEILGRRLACKPISIVQELEAYDQFTGEDHIPRYNHLLMQSIRRSRGVWP